MKSKILLYTILISCLFMCSKSIEAQTNTYPYPSSGSVGIGFTTLDGYKLTTHSNLEGQTLIDPETGDPVVIPGITPFRIIAKDWNSEEPQVGNTNSLSEAFLYGHNQSVSQRYKVYSLWKDGSLLLGQNINGQALPSYSYSIISDNSIHSKNHFLVDNHIGIGTTNPQASIDLVNGQMALNSNKINLKQAGNSYHFLKFNSQANGPGLFGYGGGVLGTSSNGEEGNLYWNNDGRVGINEADPLKTFHVNGSTFLRDNATEAARGVTDFSYTPSSSSATLLEIANGDFIIGGGASNTKFKFQMQYANPSADALYITPLVNGSSEYQNSLKLFTDGKLLHNVSLAEDIAIQVYNYEPNKSGFFFQVYGNGNVEAEDISAAEVKSVMDPDGNAFVVENNSSSNMDFLVTGDGRVFAREVEVKLGAFPDYVFNENYQLKSLGELKNYIEKNKHLPGLKSAEEVEENGIGLGELSRVQLEKIEELTLYILQLEERIKKLERENK